MMEDKGEWESEGSGREMVWVMEDKGKWELEGSGREMVLSDGR